MILYCKKFRGFLYAYVSFIWEGSSACLLLLSLERGAFETLRVVKEAIITKLLSSKLHVSLKNAVENPTFFDMQTVFHFSYSVQTKKIRITSSSFKNRDIDQFFEFFQEMQYVYRILLRSCGISFTRTDAQVKYVVRKIHCHLSVERNVGSCTSIIKKCLLIQCERRI